MHKQEKEALDEAVKKIISEPLENSLKKGDLAGTRVYKYKHNNQLYLLSYDFVEAELILNLTDHGTHENFYGDLKKH